MVRGGREAASGLRADTGRGWQREASELAARHEYLQPMCNWVSVRSGAGPAARVTEE